MQLACHVAGQFSGARIGPERLFRARVGSKTFGSPSVANAAPSSAGAIQIQAQSGGAVTVISFAGQGLTAGESYSYADAGSGSLTISPGLPPSSSAQITVQVLPAPDLVTAVSVPGVTGPVQLNRHYSWIFSGITLEE